MGTNLPVTSTIIQKVNKICRSYLWHGRDDISRPDYINWDKVCSAKSSGALGVRNLQLWNKATVGKYIWQTVRKKDLYCFNGSILFKEKLQTGGVIPHLLLPAGSGSTCAKSRMYEAVVN